MQSSTRYYVKYLGSVEVKHHKGTDVLSHAIHKVSLSQTCLTSRTMLNVLHIVEAFAMFT